MPRSRADAFSLTLLSDDDRNTNLKTGARAPSTPGGFYDDDRSEFRTPVQNLYSIPVRPGERWAVALTNLTFWYPSQTNQPNGIVNAVDIRLSIVQGARVGPTAGSIIYRISPAVLPTSVNGVLVNFTPPESIPLWVRALDDLYSIEGIDVRITLADGSPLIPTFPAGAPGNNLGTIMSLSFTRLQEIA